MMNLLQRFGVQLQSLLQGENEAEWGKLLRFIHRAVVPREANTSVTKNVEYSKDEIKRVNWNFL